MALAMREYNPDKRQIVLKKIDGKQPLSSMGLIDPRILNGENKLHALKDEKNIWSFKWQYGGLAAPMQQKFTTFTSLLDFAKVYFKKRNLDIVDVVY